MDTKTPASTFSPLLPDGFILTPEGLRHADGRPARVLLHCCCGPCSTAILEWMTGAGIRPGVFFSTANIALYAEYVRRRETLAAYAASYSLPVTDDAYDPEAWLEAVAREALPERGTDRAETMALLARIPERGARCQACFRFRLDRAAAHAAAQEYDLLTTTLASSRWKDLRQVDAAGTAACTGTGVVWWGQNWRKGGLQERRSCLIRETGMYNQPYCGCVFSHRPEEAG